MDEHLKVTKEYFPDGRIKTPFHCPFCGDMYTVESLVKDVVICRNCKKRWREPKVEMNYKIMFRSSEDGFTAIHTVSKEVFDRLKGIVARESFNRCVEQDGDV